MLRPSRRRGSRSPRRAPRRRRPGRAGSPGHRDAVGAEHGDDLADVEDRPRPGRGGGDDVAGPRPVDVADVAERRPRPRRRATCRRGGSGRAPPAAGSGKANAGSDDPCCSGPLRPPMSTMTIGFVAPVGGLLDRRHRRGRRRRRAAGRGRPSRRRRRRRRARRARRRRSRPASSASPAGTALRRPRSPAVCRAARLSVCRAAGVGEQGDASDRACTGCVAEHAGRVEHRRHGRHLDQPGLLVQRAARRPDRRGAGAHGDDRAAARHAPGDAGELAGVAERLGVHGDDPRRLVVLPELQQVVAARRRSCRRARRTTTGPCPGRRRGAAPTRRAIPDCSEMATLPGGRSAGDEQRLQPIDCARRGDAHAARADQADAEAAGPRRRAAPCRCRCPRPT